MSTSQQQQQSAISVDNSRRNLDDTNVETALQQAVNERIFLRTQNDQLWKIIEKQKAVIHNLQKDNQKLAYDKDRLSTRIRELETLNQTENSTSNRVTIDTNQTDNRDGGPRSQQISPINTHSPTSTRSPQSSNLSATVDDTIKTSLEEIAAADRQDSTSSFSSLYMYDTTNSADETSQPLPRSESPQSNDRQLERTPTLQITVSEQDNESTSESHTTVYESPISLAVHRQESVPLDNVDSTESNSSSNRNKKKHRLSGIPLRRTGESGNFVGLPSSPRNGPPPGMKSPGLPGSPRNSPPASSRSSGRSISPINSPPAMKSPVLPSSPRSPRSYGNGDGNVRLLERWDSDDQRILSGDEIRRNESLSPTRATTFPISEPTSVTLIGMTEPVSLSSFISESTSATSANGESASLRSVESMPVENVVLSSESVISESTSVTSMATSELTSGANVFVAEPTVINTTPTTGQGKHGNPGQAEISQSLSLPAKPDSLSISTENSQQRASTQSRMNTFPRMDSLPRINSHAEANQYTGTKTVRLKESSESLTSPRSAKANDTIINFSAGSDEPVINFAAILSPPKDSSTFADSHRNVPSQHKNQPSQPIPNDTISSITVKVVGSTIEINDRAREVLVFIIAVYSAKTSEDGVAIGAGKELWRVSKKYSDFLTLDAKLKLHQTTSFIKKIGKLPDKNLFTTNAPSKSDQRKLALERYLQHVVNLPWNDNRDLCEFLSSNVIETEKLDYQRTGHKEGYLTKRGKSFRVWKTRYFVLTKSVLDYYETKGGPHLGSIRLTHAQIGRQQSTVPIETDSMGGDDEYRHAFLILEPKPGSKAQTKHVLCAESDADRDEWVEALLDLRETSNGQLRRQDDKDRKGARMTLFGKNILGYGIGEKRKHPTQSNFDHKIVFGVPLDQAIASSRIKEGYELPAIVHRCVEYLDAKGAAFEEGIYRLNGSASVIKMLKDRFNSEGDVNLLAEAQPYDVHAVSGLLKLYLRELPTSVLTRDLHPEFVKVVDLLDRRERVNELGRLVSAIPLANYTLLRTLTGHLIRIVQNADINKMTMRNVGIVFSPTLGIPTGVFNLLLSEFDYIFYTDANGAAAPRSLETDSKTSSSSTHNSSSQGSHLRSQSQTRFAPSSVSPHTLGRIREESNGRSNRNSMQFMHSVPEVLVGLEKNIARKVITDNESDEEMNDLSVLSEDDQSSDEHSQLSSVSSSIVHGQQGHFGQEETTDELESRNGQQRLTVRNYTPRDSMYEVYTEQQKENQNL
ncbi:8871_t:CDS:2 [Paraglomus brasilianum]|uniref:8871_t:CDS:1 n=1 Tax=Paraglomus brasilianum TaxID=144538 RepID=A0A9N9C0C2_9GLOM|nr:8871_t:CDS:2 [Paraglomus brasilianum]